MGVVTSVSKGRAEIYIITLGTGQTSLSRDVPGQNHKKAGKKGSKTGKEHSKTGKDVLNRKIIEKESLGLSCPAFRPES